MTKARPIFFSGAMVRAILDGRKTQTRRIVKTSKDRAFGCSMAPHEIAGEVNAGAFANTPYGQPGDQLWVREAFMPLPLDVSRPCPGSTRWIIAYAAGGQEERVAPPEYNPTLYTYERWSPSIHMPRWASRITLDTASLCIEKLQDISEADAGAEGVESYLHGAYDFDYLALPPSIANFRRLWDSLNGAENWQANPWVWVIKFPHSRQEGETERG
jgi:hypothetical protein